MSAAQLRDEIVTLLAAGHETTGNALSWTFHLLSQHRDIAEALSEEVDRVLNGRAPIFTAVLPSRRRRDRSDVQFLEKLGKTTGGGTFAPRSLDEIKTAAEAIAARLFSKSGANDEERRLSRFSSSGSAGRRYRR